MEKQDMERAVKWIKMISEEQEISFLEAILIVELEQINDSLESWNWNR